MIHKKGYLFSAICFLLLTVMIINSCQPTSNREIPDVSDIEADISIRRFEQELFHLDSTKMESNLKLLAEAYPEFAPIFFDQILGVPVSDTAFIKGFITHPSCSLVANGGGQHH